MASVGNIRHDNTVRVKKTFVVVDINQSTRMKQAEAEESWVTKTIGLYTVVNDAIEAAGGRVVKFVGDGALAVFDEDRAVSAINSAITIQEALKDRRKQRVSDATVSTGIAYGSALEFSIKGDPDYIGSTVDRAYRLCSAANANAIFMDSNIIDAAPMTNVTSIVGHALDREAAQYRGDAQLVELKGFSAPVSYYEIWWDSERYGINPDFVSKKASDDKESVDPPAGRKACPEGIVAPSPGDKPQWMEGYISRAGDRFGFITSGDKEYFYVPSFVFLSNAALRNGARVTFQPSPPSQPGRHDQAMKIFAIDAVIRGRVAKLFAEKGFGFVDLLGHDGMTHGLFVLFRGSILDELSVGDEIECTIHAGERGPVGVNPIRLHPSAVDPTERIDIPDLEGF